MATALIWNNNIVSSLLPGRHRYSGHASLCLDDSWDTGGSRLDNYVSFWPKQGNMREQIGGVESTAKETILADLQMECYAPDHIIRLDNLNVSAMRAEWNTLRSEAAQYRAFRNSCATVAARVLKAGTSSKTPSHIVWTPLEVKRLALGLGGQTIGWTLLLREMALAGMINVDEEAMLKDLGKRDERHGSSTKAAYFARGKRVEGMNKEIMGRRGSDGYRIMAGGASIKNNEDRDARELDGGVLKSGKMTFIDNAMGGRFDRSWGT